MSDRLARLSGRLREQGYRVTGARRAILQELVSSSGHVSADELAALVNRRAPRVGRMTVYRTLELLQQLGLVRPIYLGSGAAHYVLLEDGHHHHLVCARCDAVVEFDDCLMQELEQRLGERYNFRVQGHLLEVVGLCESCREQEPA
ncbi:MAG: transcriptional repressor [Chloroflexi bacterium]|nr:transcriptional repressor [Chloroflexota bacterium]